MVGVEREECVIEESMSVGISHGMKMLVLLGDYTLHTAWNRVLNMKTVMTYFEKFF